MKDPIRYVFVFCLSFAGGRGRHMCRRSGWKSRGELGARERREQREGKHARPPHCRARASPARGGTAERSQHQRAPHTAHQKLVYVVLFRFGARAKAAEAHGIYTNVNVANSNISKQASATSRDRHRQCESTKPYYRSTVPVLPSERGINALQSEFKLVQIEKHTET